jgi:hypothetical protein
MTSAEANKAIVQKWLSSGVSSPEGLAMVTDDFRWVAPKSMAEMFPNGEPELVGPEGLRDIPILDKALYRGYEVAASNSNVHFMITEGDIVVMEFDAKFTSFEGEAYHNNYCLVFFLRDGKVAKVHEHVDSQYSYELMMGTPEKKAGVLDRLARLRRGETV